MQNKSDEWICVLGDSSQLAPKQILEFRHDDKDLIIWRSELGEISVMEARCPHQWSHLGSEGIVQGENIVCCSHFWSFELDGTGWKENERGRRDPKADIATFPCKEQNGKIYAQL